MVTNSQLALFSLELRKKVLIWDICLFLMFSLQNSSQCISIYVVSVNLGSMKYIENISIFKEISQHSHKEPIGNVTFYIENIFLIKI